MSVSTASPAGGFEYRYCYYLEKLRVGGRDEKVGNTMASDALRVFREAGLLSFLIGSLASV